MATEADRTTSVRGIKNPEDSSVVIPLKVIDKISFIDPRDRGQETQLTLNNGADDSRQVHVAKLTGSDGESKLDVERIDVYGVIDASDRGQETQYSLDNSTEPPTHLATHDVQIYSLDGGAWIKVRRTDKSAFIDPRDGQETVLELTWTDDDTGNPPAPLPAPVTTWDGTEINPPWRLDPWQNIIDVSWGGAVEFPAPTTGTRENFIQQDSSPIADCNQVTFSFWFRIKEINQSANMQTAYPADLFRFFSSSNMLFGSGALIDRCSFGISFGVNTGYLAVDPSDENNPVNYGSNDFGVLLTGQTGIATIDSPGTENAFTAAFRSSPNQIVSNEWYHVLISVDTNGTGDLPPLIGGLTPYYDPNPAISSFSGTATTTKKFRMFINGKNVINPATVFDWYNYNRDQALGDLPSGSWPIKFSGGYIAIPGALGDPFPTIDFCQFQMWAGKFVDPVADPTVLANFFQINTDPSTGAKTIVTAPLDETSRLAYVASGVAPADMLSRAAAPNHYGKPDLYFNGGPSVFITNRGSGGSFTKHGTPTTVGGPSGVPYDGV